jgi:mono/diheme cytochrome c family protein
MMVAATPWPFIHSPRPLFRTSEVVSALSAQPQWTSLQSECPRSYADRCATCHGPGGRGDGPIGRYLRPPPRSFADPDWAQSRTDSQLAGVIRNGGVSHGLSSMMPAQDDLSEPEVRALVRCVRSFSQSPR